MRRRAISFAAWRHRWGMKMDSMARKWSRVAPMLALVGVVGAGFLVGLESWRRERLLGRLYHEVPPPVLNAALRKDWRGVMDGLPAVTTRTTSPVLRLLKAHACLERNDGNQ